MYKNNVKVSVVTDNDNTFTEYNKDRNTYIESRQGFNYSIKIENRNNFRIEALITVDGLDVVNGSTGKFSNRGYIINKESSIIVKGFRVNSETERRFQFDENVSNSYAVKLGEGSSNLGVIGVAIFPEKNTVFSDMIFDSYTVPLVKKTVYRTPNSTLLNTADVGTNMGVPEYSKVTSTYFYRNSENPVSIFELYYRTRKTLQKMGINIHSNYVDKVSSAFPAQAGYCREVD